jgi:excisionase family DNA binding protein
MTCWKGGKDMVVNRDNPQQDIDGKQIMTASEVAVLLKVSITAVRRWTRENKLKGYKLGGEGDWRYLKKDVMFFLCGYN